MLLFRENLYYSYLVPSSKQPRTLRRRSLAPARVVLSSSYSLAFSSLIFLQAFLVNSIYVRKSFLNLRSSVEEFRTRLATGIWLNRKCIFLIVTFQKCYRTLRILRLAVGGHFHTFARSCAHLLNSILTRLNLKVYSRLRSDSTSRTVAPASTRKVERVQGGCQTFPRPDISSKWTVPHNVWLRKCTFKEMSGNRSGLNNNLFKVAYSLENWSRTAFSDQSRAKWMKWSCVRFQPKSYTSTPASNSIVSRTTLYVPRKPTCQHSQGDFSNFQ